MGTPQIRRIDHRADPSRGKWSNPHEWRAPRLGAEQGGRPYVNLWMNAQKAVKIKGLWLKPRSIMGEKPVRTAARIAYHS
jgi:hypothetical protein